MAPKTSVTGTFLVFAASLSSDTLSATLPGKDSSTAANVTADIAHGAQDKVSWCHGKFHFKITTTCSGVAGSSHCKKS